MKLTIVIPTYNRYEILLKNLNKLLPQLTDEIELYILDNNSKQKINSAFFENYNNIHYLNNRYNVGGNENILRSFEYGIGEYIWVLGDDDQISDEAIEIILYDISKNNNVTILNFYSSSESHVQRRENRSGFGFLEYLKSAENLGELLFISGLIFKREFAAINISWAHHYQMSCMPMLLIAKNALSSNNKFTFSNKTLIERISIATDTHDIKVQSCIPIVNGFSILLALNDWNRDENLELIRLIKVCKKKWISTFGVINDLNTFAITNGRYLAIRYYWFIYKNYIKSGDIFLIERLKFLLLSFVIYFPKIFYKFKIKFGIRERNFWDYD